MENNIFQSDDILLCSFLLCQKGIQLLKVKQDYQNHFIFFISNPEKCNQLKTGYLNNASAPARELFSNREMLISEIKEYRYNLSQKV